VDKNVDDESETFAKKLEKAYQEGQSQHMEFC
jgi:hypothetical protein